MKPSASAEAARPRDRVAERHGPVVLEQEQRRRGVVGDVLEHVPRLLVGEHLDPFLGRRLGASSAPASMPSSPSIPRPISAATLLPNSIASSWVRLLRCIDLHLALGVLVDGEGVDHADRVALAELLELLQDLAVEVRLFEPEHEQLNWPDCHRPPPLVRALAELNSARSSCGRPTGLWPSSSRLTRGERGFAGALYMRAGEWVNSPISRRLPEAEWEGSPWAPSG